MDVVAAKKKVFVGLFSHKLDTGDSVDTEAYGIAGEIS